MEIGNVIRIAFLQADQKIKTRPGIIIAKFQPFNDLLVCGISKSINLEVKGFDIVIDSFHPDFNIWGLKYPGLIRLGFLFTIPENLVEGAIGNISNQTHKLLLSNLSHFLQTHNY